MDKTRGILRLLAASKPADKSSLNSLKYLISMSSDLSKMLRYIQTSADSTVFTTDMMKEIFQQLSDEPLPSICFNIFRHLVVYESGRSRTDAISFIQSVIMPLMTEQEKQSFYFEAIEQFLVTPQVAFSQLAVV